MPPEDSEPAPVQANLADLPSVPVSALRCALIAVVCYCVLNPVKSAQVIVAGAASWAEAPVPKP